MFVQPSVDIFLHNSRKKEMLNKKHLGYIKSIKRYNLAKAWCWSRCYSCNA